jgi:hypothetical protein
MNEVQKTQRNTPSSEIFIIYMLEAAEYYNMQNIAKNQNKPA